jgi:transposase
MQRSKSNTKNAGIDVGKRWLDAAVHGCIETVRHENDAAGIDALIGWLQSQAVRRVGLEASGGYERQVRQALEAAGFEVVLHQPIEVRLFARLKRLRAKNDQLDAKLIAAATAQVDAVKAAADPKLHELAERLTAYEFVTERLAEMKGFMEHVHAEDLALQMRAQIKSLTDLKASLAAELRKRIKACPDLKARYDLLMSLPGVGSIVAVGLVVRMPELGQMQHGQAAALLGVAPYDRDSGQFKGQRFIAGGRRRPRRLVYIAALSAKRWDPTLKAVADRLLAKGKPKKVVIVAVMRRLIEAANVVLARGKPWLKTMPA